MITKLSLEALKATEAAAIASFRLRGRGDEKAADALAVEAMRRQFNMINIDGTVVIGEGERDKAPMLYIGEKVGTKNGPKVDIALDPLEGTTILATWGIGALSVLAMAEDKKLLNAPDVYMDKIAIGFNFNEPIINLDLTPKENLHNIALAKKCEISDLSVIILERDRHKELIVKVRESGARVILIGDGDVAAVISTSQKHTDVYMGIGGAPEGVLAATALATSGGQMCGRLMFDNAEQITRANKMGIKDLNKQYQIQDMVSGESIFIATGVTDGQLLNGIRYKHDRCEVSSVIMSSYDRSVSYITRKYFSDAPIMMP